MALGRGDLASLDEQGAVWVSDIFRRDTRMARWITSDIFSVELMPPWEATYRFGREAANGALVITTLMGAAESAAERASITEAQRRHWKYLA